MSAAAGEPAWVAVSGLMVWPVVTVVLVVVALLSVPPGQRTEMLRALADVLRAVRRNRR